MGAKSNRRLERQERLKHWIEENPFVTDEELSVLLGVSVPTVRLDRQILAIPEVRERVRNVAQDVFHRPISLSTHEVVGELLDLEINRSGLSMLEITEEMVLERTKIVRGHYLFAQANTLAVAVIGAEVVLTGSARVRYKRPVYLHERILAKATVKTQRGNTFLISVHSKVDNEIVFKAQLVLAVQDSKLKTG